MIDTLKKAAFFSFFLFIAYLIWKDNTDERDSLQWPSTNGKIIDSSVQTGTKTRDNILGGRYFTNYFILSVHYEYSVGAAKYVGHRIRVREIHYGSERSASQDLENYKAGKLVTVFYSPQKPDSSVLIPGRSRG